MVGEAIDCLVLAIGNTFTYGVVGVPDMSVRPTTFHHAGYELTYAGPSIRDVGVKVAQAVGHQSELAAGIH